MNIAFLGTPDFAVPTLKALIVKHQIIQVYTQKPRPAGRGYKLRFSPVHICAQEYGLPICTPETLKDSAVQDALKALKPDVAVVVAYGLILPHSFLDIPAWGCINIHPSLLPRWRGAAPIQRTILHGDTQTGITIVKMIPELDAGPILYQQNIPLSPDQNAHQLYHILAQQSADMLLSVLERLEHILPYPQPTHGITYAHKVQKHEGYLNWHTPAIHIQRQVNAFQPSPGTWFFLQNKRIKLHSCLAYPEAIHHTTPGTLLDNPCHVACSQGTIKLLYIQQASRNIVKAQEALHGNSAFKPGTLLQ